MNDAREKIEASPSKEFFIDMLTRDITLIEAILDLVDNSIHSVIRSADLDVMRIFVGKARAKRLQNRSIDVTISETKFRISDTCGGISIKDAKYDVFRFGRATREKDLKGLGVYGIGMKRAFFKIGNIIHLTSKTKNEEFAVDIDVNEWKREPGDWSFQFAHQRKRRQPSARTSGTTIEITELHTNVRRHVRPAAFVGDLITRVSKTYALFLRQGIRITINNKTVEPAMPALAASGNLGLTRQQLKFQDVDVLVMIGVTPKPDRDKHGWYVFCNGRMVLDADRTSLTGWSNGRLWNPKYNHFLGLVLFASKNVASLPWRTTKEGVEFESPVYQYALGQMRSLSKPVLTHLTRSYPGEVQESIPERELLESAKPVALDKVAKSHPTLFSVNVPIKSKTRNRRIQYDRPLRQIEKIAANLGNEHLSAKRVGESTFDYYLKNCCNV